MAFFRTSPGRISIELKLNLIVFAATAVALVLASSALIYGAARSARQQTLEDLVTLAEVIGNNSIAALQFNDPSDGEEILSALASKQIVNAAQLYDRSGKPFSAFTRVATSLDLPATAPADTGTWVDQGQIWMISPITHNDEHIGSVLIGADLAPLQRLIRRQIVLSILITAASALLAVFLASRLLHLILKHIRRVVDMANAVALGNLPDNLPETSRDEIGELQGAFNQIIATTRDVVRQTQTVARGDYSISIQPRSQHDELSHALIEMTARLKVFHEESEKRAWLNRGMSTLNDGMRGEQNLDTLLHNILSVAIGHLDAQAGAIYLFHRPDRLIMTAGHAVTVPADSPPTWRIGEGLIGQVAKERKLQILSRPTGEPLTLRTGLLDLTLRELILVPLVHDQQLVGVLEVGRFDGFPPDQRDFLLQASSSIAIAIESAQSRARLDELLTETRRQSKVLQEQQATLRTNNQDLEERNLLLEQQKREIHRQKEELEGAQLDLERKARELELASQYKSEFLANMSHELRTPLNSMLILSRLLLDNKPGNLDAKQLEFARTINKAGTDLLTLINDILDLSKVEAGMLDLHIESVAISDIGQALRPIFQPLAAEKHIRFDVAQETGTVSAIQTDGQRVAQILRNLIGNAFKFTTEGRVTLRIRPPTDAEKQRCPAAVAFAVEDTGIGIPADKRDLIFRAFQQADGTTSRKYGGTGLGLSISRELALRLGGDITVASEEGHGSTFTLLLPPAVAHEKNDSPSAVRPEPTPQHPSPPPGPGLAIPDDRERLDPAQRTLLIIEDDPSFARIVTDYARDKGYQILCAADGDEGIDLAARHQPYGILLDMMLPQSDGNDVIQRLKADETTRTIPVFVLSALDQDQQMLRLGAVGFLTKPVSPQDLDLAVQRIEWIRARKEKTLLVIDDDPNEARNLNGLLADWPVQVIACATGKEAISLVKSAEMDAILLDWGLDDMSGRQVIESMRPVNPTAYLPILLYTGRDLDRDEEAALRKRVVSVVLKGDQAPQRLLTKLAYYLHLPLPDEASQADAVTVELKPDHEDPPLTGATILVVDDDMRNVYSLVALLEQMGAKSLAASDGRKAIELLEQHPDVSLVLMDIMMPGMDGYQTIREIRKRDTIKDVPIIALTAKAMKKDRDQCLEAGANDYLAKPVDLDQLTLSVKAWVRT